MSSAVKILFSTRPAYGHVYPLMPLALAAREAGHDVSIATTGHFLPKLASLGFSTHDVGITIEDARDRLLASLSTAEMPKETDGRPDVEMGARLFVDMIAPARRPPTWSRCWRGSNPISSSTSSTSSAPASPPTPPASRPCATP